VRNGVTHQLQNKFAPHFKGIHCMAQHTNLVMQMLSHILVVKYIEDLLQSLYFFFHSPKKHLEFLKLVGLMKVKGNKILQNVKTCCINLLNPTKWFLSMYMPLVAKMVEDSPFLMAAQLNFKLLCDVDLFISLFCLILMLETIHGLIKFAYKRDVFVCDYVAVINICQG
jgi:hypothetical protein